MWSISYIIYTTCYTLPIETIHSLASLTQKHLMTSPSKPRACTQLPDRTRRDCSEITNLSRPLGTLTDLHRVMYLTTALNVSLPYQRDTKNIMKVTSMDHTFIHGTSNYWAKVISTSPWVQELLIFWTLGLSWAMWGIMTFLIGWAILKSHFKKIEAILPFQITLRQQGTLQHV